MSRIASLTTGHYRIPLPVPLSDSTHGVMTAFELVTARVKDADGAEGVGYTYTTGRNGGAIASILALGTLASTYPDDVRATFRRWVDARAASESS